MQINKFFRFLILMFLFIGCKNVPQECANATIRIENRWHEENRGINNFDVKIKQDITFICSRINHFPEGKDIRISYNYGYLTIFLNERKIDMIFTVENGVVYRVGIGKYVYDEDLTMRILKIMKISDSCWRMIETE